MKFITLSALKEMANPTYIPQIDAYRLFIWFNRAVDKKTGGVIGHQIYLNPQRTNTWEFLARLSDRNSFDNNGKPSYINSGSEHYERCLAIKLATLKEEFIFKDLDYAAENYHDGSEDNIDAFLNLISSEKFKQTLQSLKFMWVEDSLESILNEWVKNYNGSFVEAVKQISFNIPGEDIKILLQNRLTQVASAKTKKYIPNLFESSLKIPIEVNTTAATLAVSFYTLLDKRYLSSRNFGQVAKWVSKCFKILDRSKKNGNRKIYKHPSQRTIEDIFNDKKRTQALSANNLFRDLKLPRNKKHIDNYVNFTGTSS
ncbi:MAG: hypothetical protein KGO81_01215 [Bacteroidota bacterium]|nr:hypothetical protein [Bacteroidota bacterium]